MLAFAYTMFAPSMALALVIIGFQFVAADADSARDTPGQNKADGGAGGVVRGAGAQQHARDRWQDQPALLAQRAAGPDLDGCALQPHLSRHPLSAF